MEKTNLEYYNESYFVWQKEMGEFGGKAEVYKFEEFVNENMTVLDFGCGGGYILNTINCKEKIGIEINDIARSNAENFGIKCYKFIDDVLDNSVDLIISNHALEHVENPIFELKKLHKKLKKGGKIIFSVPTDTFKYKKNDVNFHLYSWSRMTLGNLFTCAGFEVLKVSELIHRWPPYFLTLYKVFGKSIFNFICFIFGLLKRNSCSQLRIIATKHE